MNREHKILRHAIEQGFIDPETTVVGFMDLDGLANAIKNLGASFPENFQHTFAVKANSLRHILMKINQCGIGAEVASPSAKSISP